MVKICPNCNMKNSNKSEYCINCSSNISNVKIIEEKEFDSKIDTHYSFESKEARYATNIWRPFSILGIFFAIISFFINIFFIFTFLALMLGSIGLVRGDILGILAIILGLIPLVLYFVI